MTQKDKDYLDSLDDSLFLELLWLKYGERVPVWKRCSQKEYEKHIGKAGKRTFTSEDLLRFMDGEFSGVEYRAVPYWNNGGGILDQISGREPDGYSYEKCTEYEEVIMLGSEMIEYCLTRECMKPYLKEDKL